MRNLVLILTGFGLFFLSVGSIEAACKKTTSVCSALANCISVTSLPKVKDDPVCLTGENGFVPSTDSCGAKKHWVTFVSPCGNSLAVTLCNGDPTQEGCQTECPTATKGGQS